MVYIFTLGYRLSMLNKVFKLFKLFKGTDPSDTHFACMTKGKRRGEEGSLIIGLL